MEGILYYRNGENRVFPLHATIAAGLASAGQFALAQSVPLLDVHTAVNARKFAEG